jgi:hypothetical protein
VSARGADPSAAGIDDGSGGGAGTAATTALAGGNDEACAVGAGSGGGAGIVAGATGSSAWSNSEGKLSKARRIEGSVDGVFPAEGGNVSGFGGTTRAIFPDAALGGGGAGGCEPLGLEVTGLGATRAA